jgi:hypothetical protein
MCIVREGWRLLVLSLAVICVIQPGEVQADTLTVTVNPTDDALVSSKGTNAAFNYGGAGALGVSASGLANGEFQSVLKFASSSAKNQFDAHFGTGQWMIQSISLQLTAASPTNNLSFFNSQAAGQFALSWMQNNNWTEGVGNPNSPATPTGTDITYNSLQGLLGANDENLGTFSHDASISGASVYTLSLNGASGLLGDISSGTPLSMRAYAADASVSYLFNSENFTNAANRPLLSITATTVPEPSVLALLAGGIALLLPLRIWQQMLGGRLRFPLRR